MTTPKPPYSKDILLSASDGSQAELTQYGAHVTSWMPAKGDEVLFLSRTSTYRPGVAIRGGVPIIFPQFAGRGSLPKHGFARTQNWKLIFAENNKARFSLEDNEITRAIWPYSFRAEYQVEIGGQSLCLTLRLINTGNVSFSFTAALHSYLRVEDVRRTVVQGLSGLRYADLTLGEKESVEKNELVSFPGEVDRIYFETTRPVCLIEKKRNLTVRAGFTDTVIWNPGPDKGAALTDLHTDGYLEFVCIESAKIGQPVRLGPGMDWQGVQKLTASE